MPRPPRLRRPLAALFPALLLPLSACGGETASPVDIEGAPGLEAVAIAGEPGTKPEVTWKDQLDAGDLEVETLVEGDGAEVKAGDTVLTHLWIGNGFSQEETYTTYGEGAQQISVDTEQLSPVFVAALEGQKKGSRVAVVGSAEEAFGESGNPNLGIGNKDTVLLIADLAGDPLAGPEGKEEAAPGWAPRILEKDGDVTAFEFGRTPAPADKLRKAVLVTGEGPAVQSGQTITVNYLGQVYGGAKPFDESYSKEPASFPIGTGGVVKGWDQGLVGVPVGSRVLLAIPPALGYGEQGNEQAGIKGTDTLYFVIDVLGAV